MTSEKLLTESAVMLFEIYSKGFDAKYTSENNEDYVDKLNLQSVTPKKN